MADTIGEREALVELVELKEESCTGWELWGIENPESVADHTWGTAMHCLLYADRWCVDPQRAASMVLLHDLPEVRTGGRSDARFRPRRRRGTN